MVIDELFKPHCDEEWWQKIRKCEDQRIVLGTLIKHLQKGKY